MKHWEDWFDIGWKVLVGAITTAATIKHAIDKRFEKNEKRNDDIGAAILKQNEDWNKKFEKAEEKISAIEISVAAINASITAMEKFQHHLAKNYEKIGVSFQEQLSEIGTAQEEIKNLILRKT